MTKALILVTGSTGKTGTPVVEQLLKDNYPVRAFAHRLDERSQRLSELGAEVVAGDFVDLRSVRKAMKGVKRVYFCYPPQGDRLLEAATNLAIAARNEGIRGLVNMSQVLAREPRQEPAGFPALAGGTRSGLGQHRRLAHQSGFLYGRPLPLHWPKHPTGGEDVSPLR